VISGFHRAVDEIGALLGYHAASSSNPLPTTIRRCVTPQKSADLAFVCLFVCLFVRSFVVVVSVLATIIIGINVIIFLKEHIT
jgi:hypothetical protein